MQEDTFWVKQTLNDDGQAFHHLIIKYYPSIHALIMSYVKNHEDAEDLMQEVFLKAYLELASLRHPEQFHIWLRQIAKRQCQNWLRKRQGTFLQLDEKMIYETPSTDEVLILRETLTKVIKAIDELPESESQLLKERYLDNASYDELEIRHGLSRNALAVRLLRAREKVRTRVEKLLAGVGIFSWQDALRKMLMGGVEAVKIGAKVKIIAIGVGAVLILSGTGIILWNHQQSQQEVLLANQAKEMSTKLSGNPLSTGKNASIGHISKPADNRKKGETRTNDVVVSQNSPQWGAQADAGDSNLKSSKETIDPKEEALAFRAELEARIPVLEEEIRTGMTRINARGDEIMAIGQSGNLTPEKVEWLNEQNREIQKEWQDLYLNKIWAYISCKANLDEENFKKHPQHPLAKGGEFYELAQHLPFNVTPRDFDNANWR